MSDLDKEFEAERPVDLDAEFEAEGALPAPPPEPGAADPESLPGTALRGFGQGTSFRFSDELAGANAALSAAGGKLSSSLAQAIPIPGTVNRPDRVDDMAYRVFGINDFTKKSAFDVIKEAYLKERDANRQENSASTAANPNAMFASELAGNAVLPLPGPKGASTLGRVGKMSAFGAGVGALSAAGGSNAETLSGVAGDAAVGGGLGGAAGGVFGAASAPLGRAAGWLGEKSDFLRQKIGANALLETQMGAKQVAGSSSGASSAVRRVFEIAKETLADPGATQEQISQAETILASPEAQAWLSNLRDNALKSWGSAIGSYNALTESASEAARTATDRAATLAAEHINKAGQPLKDSLVRQAQRYGVGAIGAGIGAGLGAIGDELGITKGYGKGAGIGVGGIMGAASTGTVQAVRNNWNNPRTQLLFANGAKAAIDAGQNALMRAGILGSQMSPEGAQKAGPYLENLFALQAQPQAPKFSSSVDQASTPTTPPARSPRFQSPTPSDTSAPDAGFEDLKKRLGIDGAQELSEQHYLSR